MSAFEPGDYVHHRSKSDWGYGRVMSVELQLVTIRFEHDEAEERFQTARARDLLERVLQSEVPAPVKVALAGKRTVRHGAAATTATCATCGVRPNRSRCSMDGRWKACPKCSATHGRQHGLRRRPEAFGCRPTPMRDMARAAVRPQRHRLVSWVSMIPVVRVLLSMGIGTLLSAGCSTADAPAAATGTTGCRYDTQCKGDRVCVQGQCIGPAQNPAPVGLQDTQRKVRQVVALSQTDAAGVAVELDTTKLSTIAEPAAPKADASCTVWSDASVDCTGAFSHRMLVLSDTPDEVVWVSSGDETWHFDRLMLLKDTHTYIYQRASSWTVYIHVGRWK